MGRLVVEIELQDSSIRRAVAVAGPPGQTEVRVSPSQARDLIRELWQALPPNERPVP